MKTSASKANAKNSMPDKESKIKEAKELLESEQKAAIELAAKEYNTWVTAWAKRHGTKLQLSGAFVGKDFAYKVDIVKE